MNFEILNNIIDNNVDIDIIELADGKEFENFKEEEKLYFYSDCFNSITLDKNYYINRKTEIDSYFCKILSQIKNDYLSIPYELLSEKIINSIIQNDNIDTLAISGDCKSDTNIDKLVECNKKILFDKCNIKYCNSKNVEARYFLLDELYQILDNDLVDKIKLINVKKDICNDISLDNTTGELVIGSNYYLNNGKYVNGIINKIVDISKNKLTIGSFLYNKIKNKDNINQDLKKSQKTSIKVVKPDIPNEILNEIIFYLPSNDIALKFSKSNDIIKLANNKTEKIFVILSNLREFSLEQLYQLSDCNITFIDEKYKDHILINDLIKAKEIIKYIVDEINNKNFSPLEKYVYAYKIVTQFKKYFSEYDDQSYGLSRSVVQILFNNYCVCVGYTDFLINIIDELNEENLMVAEYTCDVGGLHSRCLVGIKDKKYEIEGIYVSDPTNDSINYYNGCGDIDHILLKKKKEKSLKEKNFDVSDYILFDNDSNTFGEEGLKKFFDNFKNLSNEKISSKKIRKALLKVQSTFEYKDLDYNALNLKQKFMINNILRSDGLYVSKDNKLQASNSILCTDFFVKYSFKKLIKDTDLLYEILNSNIDDSLYIGGFLKVLISDYISKSRSKNDLLRIKECLKNIDMRKQKEFEESVENNKKFFRKVIVIKE